jgi:hypothetical protein
MKGTFMANNIKVVYVGDPMGDIESECETIRQYIETERDIDLKIKIKDILPKVLKDGKFDVLFFDWGGMSIGNDLLEHFCEDIVEHAHDHPQKEYVVTSHFTYLAMKDAATVAGANPLGRPVNLFMSLEEWCESTTLFPKDYK